MLQNLTKPQLVDIGKRLGVPLGDYARKSKDELSALIEQQPADSVTTVVESLGLISGAWSAPAKAAAPAAPAEVIPDIKVVASKTLSEVFGIRGKYAKIAVDVWNDPAAPVLDKGYKFDAALLFSAVIAMKRGRNVWLAGPAGTGKTEFVKNLCAGLGRAFVRVSFDSSAEKYEFIGGERVKNGSTIYQRGVVLRGFTRPGAVVLLDEVSFARPEYLSALHAALEPDAVITVPETGEVIKKAPGVVFFAADNSNGRGDFTGMYVGVREQNVAFVNRFSKTLKFTYLSPSVESQVIAYRSGCQLSLAKLITQFLSICRQAGDAAQLDHIPTLREAFSLAEALTDGQAYRDAFEEVLVNRASPESAEVLQQLWKANVADYLIEDALNGVEVKLPNAPVVIEKTEEVDYV